MFGNSLVIAGQCSTSFLWGEKHLRDIYYDLRKADKNCNLKPIVYKIYGERALLAGRVQEAWWSAQKGLWAHNKTPARGFVEERLRLLAGRALTEMGRHEEAISYLKKLALSGDTSRERPVLIEIREQAFMALIKTYYNRAHKKTDKNVRYLVTRFKKEFPHSRYKPLVNHWLNRHS